VSNFNVQENFMRRLLILTFASLTWAMPVLAQDAPHDQPAAPNAAQDQNDALKDALQEIQRTIQMRLALAGYTDIQMVPTSFLISAKDRDGHSVSLRASPGLIANLDDTGPDGQGDGAGDMPSSQPSTTGRGPNEEM
jgi:hypothetical protein